MNINRHNYEEFFLLYVDNELTAEQRKSVEQFLRENADLAGELELFRQTSLVSDDNIVFAGKELLMKQENDSSVNLKNYQEWMISYIDNELTITERKEFEHFISFYPAVQEELAVFLQTKLQPEQEIVFINKEILFRKEEKVRVITLQWWKIAVAAAVILVIGFTTFSVLNRNTIVPDDFAGTIKKTQNGKDSLIAEPNTKKEEQTNPAAVENNDAVASVDKLTDKTKIVPVQKINQEKIKAKTVTPKTIVVDNSIAKTEAPVRNKDVAVINKPVEIKIADNAVTEKNETASLNNTVAANTTTAKENINNPVVTNNTNKPSDDKETAYDKTSDTGAVFASNNDEGKNKKLRGFFRKATRIFEKRTNISAADDDDKVLIGVLAVKLK